MRDKGSTSFEQAKEKMRKLQVAKEYPKRFSLPIGLQFELTAKCNLTCKHCYNRSGDDDQETTMTVDNWISLSRELVEHGGIFQCILSGGEPLLLGDRLFEIMDVLHEDKTSFILISNGMLMTSRIAKKLSKYNFYRIQISIDGSEENIHDQFRQKDGSWKKAIEAALHISSHGMPLTIASSVTPENIDQMKDMADLSYSLGASSIIFGEIMLSGRASEFREILLNDDLRKNMITTANMLSEKFMGRMQINIGAAEEHQLSLNQVFPTDTAIIRPNGDVRLDCTAPFTMGNIFKDSFVKIWEERASDIWQKKQIAEYKATINKGLGKINHVDKDVRL